MRDEEYRAMFELEERLWWYQGMRAITTSLLSRSLSSGGTKRLLDVGCGTGYSLSWLRERFRLEEIYGVDLSPRAAEFWRARGLNTVSLGSADKLPFCGKKFYVVNCFDLIYLLVD